MLSCKHDKAFQEISVQVWLTLFLNNTTLISGFWRTWKTLVDSFLCLQNAINPRCWLGPWLAIVFANCLFVWRIGVVQMLACCCNDDEAVFVVVAVLSLAASWSGWRLWSVVTTQVRRIMEKGWIMRQSWCEWVKNPPLPGWPLTWHSEQILSLSVSCTNTHPDA